MNELVKSTLKTIEVTVQAIQSLTSSTCVALSYYDSNSFRVELSGLNGRHPAFEVYKSGEEWAIYSPDALMLDNGRYCIAYKAMPVSYANSYRPVVRMWNYWETFLFPAFAKKLNDRIQEAGMPFEFPSSTPVILGRPSYKKIGNNYLPVYNIYLEHGKDVNDLVFPSIQTLPFAGRRFIFASIEAERELFKVEKYEAVLEIREDGRGYESDFEKILEQYAEPDSNNEAGWE